jgi:chromosome partitioning protein
MPVVSIYNNKGGVGKSTLTVGLAEFLAANRKKSVLVIDLDAQASSSGVLLGGPEVNRAVSNQQTIAARAAQVLGERRPVKNLSDRLTYRPASKARGMPLAQLALLVPDKEGIFAVEEQMNGTRDQLALRDYLKPALGEFEFVLIDLPGNINRRDKLAVSALVMSDFVLGSGRYGP